MYTIGALLLFAAIAEILRRCCMICINAFTGPLSEVPGPFINKLSKWPWLYHCLTGNMVNLAPRLFEKYGSIVRITPTAVLVADKAGIQKILIDEDFKKAPEYEAIRPEHDITSLITETDKVKYKHRRRILSPGFAISYLNGLEPLVQDCINIMSKVLDVKCKEGRGYTVVDIEKMFGNLTSDIMGATSFGGSLGLVESEDEALKDMFMKRLVRAAVDASFPFLKYLPFVPPISASELNIIIDDIIAKRRKEMVENSKPTRDLVQIFIDNNDADPVGFSEKHIREEMVLFMIAGSDTTAFTETCTLLLLLNNPEKLKTLLDEIDTAFPSRDASITFANTQDLPYLNGALNEGMRLMPIVGGLSRITTDSTVLCGKKIPSGTIIQAFIQAMMVDPKIWPDPKSFVPERWIKPYKGVEADRKAFMPFSAGSRNCPGQQFAMKSLRLTIATLLHRHEISLIAGQSHELRYHTVPWFKQGYYKVGFRPRARCLSK